jgi:hypothetical protein
MSPTAAQAGEANAGAPKRPMTRKGILFLLLPVLARFLHGR